MHKILKIQGNTYCENNAYAAKNGEPVFTCRGRTELLGVDIRDKKNSERKFENTIKNHPAVNNFFEKYDGNFVIVTNDGTSASSRYFRNKPTVMGRLGLRYTNPMHPDELCTEWFIDVNGSSSNESVDDIIEKMLSSNTEDIPEKLCKDCKLNELNGQDVLSLYLDYVDGKIEIEKIESTQEFLRTVRKVAIREAKKRYYINKFRSFYNRLLGSKD